jgi:hypothetical protein
VIVLDRIVILTVVETVIECVTERVGGH